MSLSRLGLSGDRLAINSDCAEVVINRQIMIIQYQTRLDAVTVLHHDPPVVVVPCLSGFTGFPKIHTAPALIAAEIILSDKAGIPRYWSVVFMPPIIA